MNKFLILGFVLFIFMSSVMAEVFDDGLVHLIDDDSYLPGGVELDFEVDDPPLDGTHADVVEGAKLDYLVAGNSATIKMEGGEVRSHIGLVENAEADLLGGNISELYVYQSAVARRTNAYIGSIHVGSVFGGGGNIETGGGSTEFLYVYDQGNAKITSGDIAVVDMSGRAKTSMSGGNVRVNFFMRDSSVLDVSGGSIPFSLDTFDNSAVNITGGDVGIIHLFNETSVAMSGGDVYEISAMDRSSAIVTGGNVCLSAADNSIIEVFGGTLEYHLVTYESGQIFLHGSGFEVTDLEGNITSLLSGDVLSDFGSLVDVDSNSGIYHYLAGTISGVLADGSVLDNEFRIYNDGRYEGIGDITVIPEPCGFVLLVIGGLIGVGRKVGLRD